MSGKIGTEAAERAAKESAERAAREAAERAAKESAERAARESAERAARESAERAARESAESAASAAAKGVAGQRVAKSTVKKRFASWAGRNSKKITLALAAGVTVAMVVNAANSRFDEREGARLDITKAENDGTQRVGISYSPIMEMVPESDSVDIFQTKTRPSLDKMGVIVADYTSNNRILIDAETLSQESDQGGYMIYHTSPEAQYQLMLREASRSGGKITREIASGASQGLGIDNLFGGFKGLFGEFGNVFTWVIIGVVVLLVLYILYMLFSSGGGNGQRRPYYPPAPPQRYPQYRRG